MEKLPRAKDARWNAEREGGPVSCFADTRKKVLADIEAWTLSDDPNTQRVFWLNGMAGIGKSTIARTIAESAHKRGILGGSFFFSRNTNDLRNPKLVFPTLAYHLSFFQDRAFMPFIAGALQDKADPANADIRTQFNDLILDPLRSYSPTSDIGQVLLVVDALDECESEQSTKDILRLILTHVDEFPFVLRVFLTSRPEPYIQSVFEGRSDLSKFILHDVEKDIVQGDIQRYLESRLSPGPLYEEVAVSVPAGWPTTEDIKKLVALSGQLFIFAATAVRFIGDITAADPPAMLQIILGTRDMDGAAPYTKLDELYLQVLGKSVSAVGPREDMRRWHQVVGSIVLLRDPLPVAALARLLRYEAYQVSNILRRLGSIILTPSSDTEAPRIYHLSFPNFITDPLRCTDKRFTIHTPTQEKSLLLQCLGTMMKLLHYDMAGSGTIAVLNTSISDDVIKQAIPLELEYACQFWCSHLLKVDTNDSEVIEQLEIFSFKCLLFWIEAMSLLGATRHAIDHMRDAYQCAVSIYCCCIFFTLRTVCKVKWAKDTAFETMLYDGLRFITKHQVIISSSSMNTYMTALLLTPQDTTLYKVYKDLHKNVQIVYPVESTWSPLLCTNTLAGNAGIIMSVAYAPDGSCFATGSWNGCVDLWNGISGAYMRRLTNAISEQVTEMCFLSDCKQLVTAQGNVAYLWDVDTGVLVLSFNGHSENIKDISLTSDQLATVSDDNTIKIWEIHSGGHQFTIKTDARRVSFLSSGFELLSTNDSGPVSVWNTQNGELIRQFSTKGKIHFISNSNYLLQSLDSTCQVLERDSLEVLLSIDDFYYYTWSNMAEISYIAINTKNGSLEVWDIVSRCQVTKITLDKLIYLALSPNGRLLVSGKSCYQTFFEYSLTIYSSILRYLVYVECVFYSCQGFN